MRRWPKICTGSIAQSRLKMKFLSSTNAALRGEVLKQIFDHVRNYLICALLLAVGITELREHNSMLFGLISSRYSGVGVVAIALFLMLINLYDGIRRISRARHHLLLTAGIILLYVFLSVRVVEMTLNYRAPGSEIDIGARFTDD